MPSASALAASALVAAGFLGLASLQQRDGCAQLVVATTATYGLLFGLLKAAGSPAASAQAAEWRERRISNINALILIVGSGLCFGAPHGPSPSARARRPSAHRPIGLRLLARAPYALPPPRSAEWPSYEGAEGWISQGVAMWPIVFASLFVGYLQWDVLWMLWHEQDGLVLDELAHHLIFIAISHYAQRDPNGAPHPLHLYSSASSTSLPLHPSARLPVHRRTPTPTGPSAHHLIFITTSSPPPTDPKRAPHPSTHVHIISHYAA